MKVQSKVILALATLLLAVPALAQDAAATSTVSAGVGSRVSGGGLGNGRMVGRAVLGGTLGQSRAASAALDGMARNPATAGQLRTALILSLALIESLVLFAFLIAIILQGSVGAALKRRRGSNDSKVRRDKRGERESREGRDKRVKRGRRRKRNHQERCDCLA